MGLEGQSVDLISALPGKGVRVILSPAPLQGAVGILACPRVACEPVARHLTLGYTLTIPLGWSLVRGCFVRKRPGPALAGVCLISSPLSALRHLQTSKNSTRVYEKKNRSTLGKILFRELLPSKQ